jgi:hypothetical protein
MVQFAPAARLAPVEGTAAASPSWMVSLPTAAVRIPAGKHVVVGFAGASGVPAITNPAGRTSVNRRRDTAVSAGAVMVILKREVPPPVMGEVWNAFVTVTGRVDPEIMIFVLVLPVGMTPSVVLTSAGWIVFVKVVAMLLVTWNVIVHVPGVPGEAGAAGIVPPLRVTEFAL